MKFPLAQEVSRHVRDKACHFPVQTAPSTAVRDEKPADNRLGLLESSLGEILSPTEELPSQSDETEFGMLVDEMAGEEQVVEVNFSCKSCGFT
jgi:hypothetical protein